MLRSRILLTVLAVTLLAPASAVAMDFDGCGSRACAPNYNCTFIPGLNSWRCGP